MIDEGAGYALYVPAGAFGVEELGELLVGHRDPAPAPLRLQLGHRPAWLMPADAIATGEASQRRRARRRISTAAGPARAAGGNARRATHGSMLGRKVRLITGWFWDRPTRSSANEK